MILLRLQSGDTVRAIPRPRTANEPGLSKLEKATNGRPTVVSPWQDQIERQPSQSEGPSRLEKRVGLAAESTTSMRPLGGHLMVDAHGIIWDGGKPVGVWDVNNGH